MINDNEKRLIDTINNLENEIYKLRAKVDYLNFTNELKDRTIDRKEKRIVELVESYKNYIRTGKVEFKEDNQCKN